MKKIAIVTDSNSGMSQAMGKELGVSVVPMPFIVNDEEYFEDINLTQEEFYSKLKEGADILTSQPAIGQVTELWDKLLEDYQEVLHIPMSSALSQSMATAKSFAQKYQGKVEVVDNRSISITQRQAVLNALELVKEGKRAKEIRTWLEEHDTDTSIYIMVDTLKYLKKGGRLTPAVAAIGTILRIKPVLQIQCGKLDTFAKVTNVPAGKNKMITAIKKDLETRFAEFVSKGEMVVAVAYTDCREKAEQFAEEIKKEIPDVPFKFIDPLSLSVSCHIGPGALAVGTMRVYKK